MYFDTDTPPVYLRSFNCIDIADGARMPPQAIPEAEMEMLKKNRNRIHIMSPEDEEYD